MLLIKSIFLNSQNLGPQKSDDAGYKMEGGACKGHEGASVSTLDHSPYIAHSFFFLGHYYILFAVFQTATILSWQSPNCRQIFIKRVNQNFMLSYSKLFLPPPLTLKTKCFWAKLLIFSLFIGFMAEGGFYGRALTQRPKSITFLQHPHSGPDTSPFWQNHQKYMFFAKCFCNTITLARILSHFEKIIMICPDNNKNQKKGTTYLGINIGPGVRRGYNQVVMWENRASVSVTERKS